MLKQVVTIGAMGVLMSGCSVFNKTTDNIDTANKITPFAVKKAYEHKAKIVEEQVVKVPDWYTKILIMKILSMQLVLQYHQSYNYQMILQS